MLTPEDFNNKGDIISHAVNRTGLRVGHFRHSMPDLKALVFFIFLLAVHRAESELPSVLGWLWQFQPAMPRKTATQGRRGYLLLCVSIL